MKTLSLARMFSAALMAVAVAGCKPKAEAPAPQPEAPPDMSSLFRQPVPPEAPAAVTGPVATVNGVSIPAEDFLREMSAAIGRLQRQLPPEQLAQMQPRIQEQVVEQMIARQLLIQEANRQQLQITPEEIENSRKRLEASLPPGLTLEQILAQRNVTEEQFQREFGDEVRITKLIEGATSNKLHVADEEVTTFYEENRERFKQPETATARHILVAVEDEAAKETKRAEAEAIRKRLLDGEDFAAVAREKTDDPGSRETGGLYTFPRGQMVPPFEEAAFSQPFDEIGPLVETQFGFHIIKVEKREPGRDVPLDEVRSNVVAFLRTRKAPEAVQEYLGTLRTNAQVEVLLKN